MEQELKYLGHALESPERPFVAILGGAKVSDKIEVIENLLGKVDRLLIGGAMAYTFFKSRGVPIGKSLVEDDKLDAARRDRGRRDGARRHARAAGRSRRHRPSSRPAPPHEVLAVGDAAIGDRHGPRHRAGDDRRPTRARSRDAKTVVWNGPMGVFEIDAFATGTNAVARAVAAVKGTTIIGGGDSIAAVKKAGIADRITHISTGGGASLEFLGGRTLPGRRGADGQVGRAGLQPSSCRSIAHANPVHRRQLEDVQDRPRGGRLRQGAARASSRTSPTSRSSSRRRSPRVHAVAEAARNIEHRRRGAGPLLGARGRVHRRGVGRR